jgi:hypothetical protein
MISKLSINERLTILVIWSVVCFYVVITLSKEEKPIDPVTITLTKTDTIYMKIDSLEIKSDTIKMFYEKKINQYRVAPADIRVQLFTKRVNR